MNPIKLPLIAITAIIIAACSTSKKGSTSTAASTSAPAATVTTTTSTNNMLLAKRTNGIYAPGNEELTAIQVHYKDVTIEKLKEGYTIYTEGACVNCHNAKSIYRHEEAEWKDIVDDMAGKARISDSQKDAVYKYVLAIKATQLK